jgi:hypothetical protein
MLLKLHYEAAVELTIYLYYNFMLGAIMGSVIQIVYCRIRYTSPLFSADYLLFFCISKGNVSPYTPTAKIDFGF